MRKHNQKDIDSLVNKILSETLEEKANSLVSRLNNKEVNELGGMGGSPHPKFGEKNFSKMSSKEIEDLLNDYGDDSDEDDDYKDLSSDNPYYGDDSDDFDYELDEELEEDNSEICECGGKLYEGTCNECGGSYGSMDEENEFDDEGENFDSEENVGGCKAVRDTIEQHGGEPDELDLDLIKRYNCKSLNESLKGGQKKLDKNKNNKIDSEDFKLLRGEKTETKESLKGGQKNLDKNKNNKIDAEDFKLLRGKKTETKEGNIDEKWDTETETPKSEKGKYKGKTLEELKSMLSKVKKTGPHKKGTTDYEKQNELEFAIRAKSGWGKVKESVKLTESELIDLIESIVKEDMKGAKHRGMSEYEKAHKGSGKESEDYIKSVTKKMSDYLKDGSKGDYDMNPKMFPKGNGQIEKMNTKKYTMSKDGEEFVDDFLRPGMENLDYDEIQPNEEWMKNNIEGSSKTGNNPKWGNAEETELGEKINKKRKENKFAKLRRQAYNKAPQPVIDNTGEDSGKGINIKLESTDKQTKVLNEEFTKIQHLMGYSRKTQ